MQLPENRKYAIAVPTSMGVRITPPDGQPVSSANTFLMQATSAETNVVTIASSLGMRALALTTFVKDSPIAAFIKSNLRQRGIDYIGKEVEQGGPWGYRHQFNIADSGFGVRGPRVHNDRAGEVGRTLNARDFDLDGIFARDGVSLLHMSGLIAALSPETGDFCVNIAEAAKRHGTLISFDLNYRESFWEGRKKELREKFLLIASKADILIGNEEDFQLCFGISGPEAGGKGVSNKIGSFRSLINKAEETFPNAKVFATTLREVVAAGSHVWGAILKAEGNWYEAEPREIAVLDRIGGGDGFVGGLLYGILKGWDYEKCLNFGWATGALATTYLTDYADISDEKQVWSAWGGDARVKR